ncbi:MAG: hypothetical protein K1X78_26945 [Verrucomicrobiaceae bacterium]|nr:hypothetical protein [Verrucomicrobiaceae bacterium]
MKISTRARTVAALILLVLACVIQPAKAGAPTTCDQIGDDVRTAIEKDPSKVLMIVEDALVINEACACEVVKAAILAAKADDATVQQIVQTALAVAPKMSAIIVECATAVAPGSADTLGAISKDKRDTSSEKVPGSDFGDAWATNIRGVYLIQPAASGFVTQTESSEDSKGKSGGGGGDNKGGDDDTNDDDVVNRANSRRTRNLVALSPAQVQP